jgi:replicative DNA helicase
MSMGKTSNMLSMALAASRNCLLGHAIGIVSLEMSKGALTNRLVAMISGQSASGIEDGASWIDWDAVAEAQDELEVLPIRIIDAGGAARRTNGSRGRMTVVEIARHARAWHQSERLDGVFVDYLELVTPRPEDAKEPRDVKLGSTAQGLKALAEELAIPVILLAQANRETEKRTTHVPTLADIRGTDELAGVADVVLFPVVWDYYRVRGQELPSEAANLPPGVVDLFVAKQRNRSAGKVRAFFLADRMQVVDYDERRQCPVDYHGNVIPRVSYQGV